MREKTFSIVRNVIEELNEELEYETLMDVSDETPVYGGEEGIDSLSLVTLVVRIEQELESAFGRHVILSDEKAMSLRNSPYRNAGSLVDFIVARLGETDG